MNFSQTHSNYSTSYRDVRRLCGYVPHVSFWSLRAALEMLILDTVWRSQCSASQRYPGYMRIRMCPVCWARGWGDAELYGLCSVSQIYEESPAIKMLVVKKISYFRLCHYYFHHWDTVPSMS